MKKNQFSDNKMQLWELISDKGLLREGNFTLASKVKSTFYFDIKKVSMLKIGKLLIGKCIEELIEEDQFDSVGGMESGAIPIIDAVVEHTNIERGFYVKKAIKDHGTQKAIEGYFFPKDTVLMVEDVITSGNSVIRACKIVENISKNAGGKIKKIIVIVDRLQGGRENIEKEGYQLIPIFTKDDFKI
ncbi:MAG: orotate phosphoribosyltransferase [Candidatus Helarchaeota archaeon]|nr:orotate phosphoribosyltransferase [Candidatus Helarchaeota archaeon]